MNNISSPPLVSICCITFNHAKYIQDCLDGFLMQKCDFGFEVLIHDDASTDGTQDIIKKYQELYPEIIKPYFQTENQYSKGIRGMNPRFNFPRAKGKYIAMCEGDDYWTDPLKLQKQVDFLENNPDYVLTGHLRTLINEKNDKTLSNLKGYYTQCLVFRNVLKDDYLSYEAKITYGDELLIIYLKNFGKFKILDFVGAVYRITTTGVYQGANFDKLYNERKLSFYNMKSFFEKYEYKDSVKLVDKYILDNELFYTLKNDKKLFLKSMNLLKLALKFKSFIPLKSLLYINIKGQNKI